jgi:hypothetical protein
MSVLKPAFLVKRFATAILIVAATFAAADVALAAEGPTLPPAEYKPLPVGTEVKYEGWSFKVINSEGFKTSVKTASNKWFSYYGLFGKEGSYVYSRGNFTAETEYKEEIKTVLKGFWPLEVGKKAEINFVEYLAFSISAVDRAWRITLEVVGTAFLDLDGIRYPTYVVKVHSTGSPSPGRDFSVEAEDYIDTRWYHPESGLILKSERKWIHGSNEGTTIEYALKRVTYPKGTTTLALKGTKILAGGEADKALVAEVKRQKQKVEEALKAQAAGEKARLAEVARLKQEAEAERKAREAEMARLKRETEKAEKARQTEIARLKKEAEEAQKAGGTGADKVRAVKMARLEKEVEQRHWDSVQDSPELAAVQNYVKKYPSGRYVAEAKARVAVLQRLASANKIDFGNYHALVIGINNYKHLPKLQMATKDAKAVAKVLENDYGFKVTLLIDPIRNDIVDAFDELQETLNDKDNLLIYYAGHGWLNEEVDRGYWLPVDAKPKRRSRWISNATITDTLKGLSAKHVMVVADSCYSGTLVRAANVGTRKRTGDYWKEMATKWARVAITSGGLEPVADKGGGENSPFAKAFIDTLKDNRSVMEGTTMFSKLRRPVMVAADQTPQYADVRGAGHDGGDFLFVRKK